MLERGKKVGEYVLLEKLGAGGFGDVWKAEKRTALDVNHFALKFFRPNEDRIDFDKIGRELAVWKQLRGLPHILSVIELDQFEDYVYVVSDFADGGSLGQWLKTKGGKAASPEEAVGIALEILTGLENLHEKGFVHRDLKPDNILILNSKFCLADFGISREIKTHSKATGTAGTMEYMPPEAFERSPSVTPQTDIWAVGVILQKLLTGALPYPQEEQPSLIAAILMSDPEPMPAGVSEALRAIVGKALRKNREDRFQTAREMREALKMSSSVQLGTKKREAKTEDLLRGSISQNEEKTENLVIKPTQDGQAIEAEKERQRKLAEEERRKEAEEVRRLQEIEARRRQNEIDEIQRNLKPQTSGESASNLWKWVVGGVSGLIALILGIVGIGSLLNNNDSKAGNASANKSSVANTAANKAPADSSNPLKNSIGMEFVKIPAGSFTMGSPPGEKDRSDDETQHRVTISKDFYLGKYEVTQAQWKAVMGSNPSNFKGDNLPVENVSWDDVQEFIKKLNAKGEGTYRLPTEAEWEYAARGGKDGEVFGIGDGKNLSSEEANFDGNYPYGNAVNGNYLKKTANVGSYQANDFGLYDMHGNVWEWCADWYGAYSDANVTDPTGADSGAYRVARGGGWGLYGKYLRSALRNGNRPLSRNDLGFRLVRD